MKTIFKIIFLTFFTIYCCKTKQNEKTEPNTKPPEVEFSQFNLGESGLPKLKSEVNDFEFIFTVEELEKLTLMIRDFEKTTTNQIAVVSIKSIGNYTDFKKFAIDLSNYNGVGLKRRDNGLTIVFSKNLRKIRISTGLGTEKILTDEICKTIIDKTIIPEFRNGDYYSGIEKGIKELIDKWK